MTLTEAKAKFSAVIEQVAAGEDIVITKMGKPIARISALEQKEKPELRPIGWLKGQIRMADDFDEWPEEEARALGIID